MCEQQFANYNRYATDGKTGVVRAVLRYLPHLTLTALGASIMPPLATLGAMYQLQGHHGSVMYAQYIPYSYNAFLEFGIGLRCGCLTTL